MISVFLLFIFPICVLCVYYFEVIGFIQFVKRLNELPRKKGYPILGNILEFMGSPEDVFRQVTLYSREYCQKGLGVLWLSLMPLVLITEPDIIERICKNTVNINKGIVYNVIRPWLNDGLLTSSDKKWHTRRKILTPAFHFNILQKFLHIFNEGSRSTVEGLKKHINEEVNVCSVISKFTLDTICESAMGTKLSANTEEGERYRSSVHEFGVLSVERTYKTWLLVDIIFRFSSKYWQQIRILETLHTFTNRVIKARKESFLENPELNENHDIQYGMSKRKMAMLDLLISAQKRGEDIDDEGIREEVDTFVFEGHDTTAVSLSFSLMLLANNRQCQEKIYEEMKTIFEDDDRDPTNDDLLKMKYLECCIKESLRLYPSVPKVARRLGENITLDDGLTIPKGSTTVFLIYEMHRRADLYPNPEKFDPDRFQLENSMNKHPFAYLPFSAGSRNCIGQKFAMMEMKCFLAAVVRNFILEPIDTPGSIECIMDIVLRTKNPIRVKFIPRNT